MRKTLIPSVLIVEHYHCCDRLLFTCLVAGKDVRGDYKSAWYSLGSVLRSSAAKKGGKFLRENDARKRFGGEYQSASVSGRKAISHRVPMPASESIASLREPREAPSGKHSLGSNLTNGFAPPHSM